MPIPSYRWHSCALASARPPGPGPASETSSTHAGPVLSPIVAVTASATRSSVPPAPQPAVIGPPAPSGASVLPKAASGAAGLRGGTVRVVQQDEGNLLARRQLRGVGLDLVHEIYSVGRTRMWRGVSRQRSSAATRGCRRVRLIRIHFPEAGPDIVSPRTAWP